MPPFFILCIYYIPEQSLPGGVIPSIIVQCVAYLNRPSCLIEEGLFRIPGDMSQIRKLRDSFLAGELVRVVI